MSLRCAKHPESDSPDNNYKASNPGAPGSYEQSIIDENVPHIMDCIRSGNTFPDSCDFILSQLDCSDELKAKVRIAAQQANQVSEQGIASIWQL